MSEFTAWLRSNGLEHLAPLDDQPRAFYARIAELQKRGAGYEQFKELYAAWQRWKAV